MNLSSANTMDLILELSIRSGVKDILVTKDQDFKIKIGADNYEYEGPCNIIIVEK